MDLLPWTKGRLPTDFTHGYVLGVRFDTSAASVDSESMKQRLLMRLYIQNGVLDTEDFIGGENKRNLCRWFCESLDFTYKMVRKIHWNASNSTLMRKTDREQFDRFLRNAPHLSEFVFIASGSTQSTIHALEALAQNKFRPLRKLEFHGLRRRNPTEAHRQQMINVLGRLDTLEHLSINGCSNNILDAICSGVVGHSTLRSLFVRGSSYSAKIAAVMVSCPNLERIELNFAWWFSEDSIKTDWLLLLSLLQNLVCLKTLKFDLTALSDARPGLVGQIGALGDLPTGHELELAVDVDDFAVALAGNHTLTDICINSGGPNQAKFDYVCRLFGKRNQIEQRVKRNEIDNVAWPWLLDSLRLNPTAIYMVLPYIPFPTRSGKRKANDAPY